MTRTHAFSLTELLVVIAVILILVSLLIVGSGEAYDTAQRVACQHRLEQIGQACATWSLRNDGRELRSTDTMLGAIAPRWYERLIPYVGGKTLADSLVHLNCPMSDADEGPGDGMVVGTGGRGFYMPIVLYASTNDGFYHNSFEYLRDDFRSVWPGGCDWRWRGCSDDGWIWSQNGLNSYGEFWLFSIDQAQSGMFRSTVPAEAAKAETVKVFREGGGGGIFMSGDHSACMSCFPSSTQEHTIWNASLNQLADYCELGICNKGFYAHNMSIATTGHDIGRGLTVLPPGLVPGTVGRVQVDPRHPARHPYVQIVIRCSGTQPRAESYGCPSCPGGAHAQPCGHTGVMDDGLGRVCVDDTFTRWGTGYYASTSTYNLPPGTNRHGILFEYAKQIAIWLAGGAKSSTGNVTYGYNNQVGRAMIAGEGSALRAGVRSPRDTIRVLDYKFYEADHDGEQALVADDDITCIAPRHGGRANVLFCDGRVEALTPEEIMSPANNYWNVRK